MQGMLLPGLAVHMHACSCTFASCKGFQDLRYGVRKPPNPLDCEDGWQQWKAADRSIRPLVASALWEAILNRFVEAFNPLVLCYRRHNL